MSAPRAVSSARASDSVVSRTRLDSFDRLPEVVYSRSPSSWPARSSLPSSSHVVASDEAPSPRARRVTPSGPSPAALLQHRGPVSAVAWFGADAGIVISGGLDGQLLVWDAAHVRPVTALRSTMPTSDSTAPSLPVSCVATRGRDAALGSLVAVCRDERSVRLVDLRAPSDAHVLEGHSSPAACASWCPWTAHELASGDVGGEVCIWDVRSGGSRALLRAMDRNARPPSDWHGDHGDPVGLRTRRAHLRGVTAIAWSSRCRGGTRFPALLTTGCEGGCVHVWHTEGGWREPAGFDGVPALFETAGPSVPASLHVVRAGAGQSLVVYAGGGASAGDVAVWNLTDGGSRVGGVPGPASVACMRESTQELVIASWDGRVSLSRPAVA